MDGLANDLALKLVDSGIQHGRLIALYMDKSIESLSTLAMHKAGGSYVPLDIDHPTEHIQIIIRLAQTTTVLTTTEHHSQRASTILNGTVEVVSIEIRDLSLGAKPDVGRVGQDNVCHVLFTSGSTGTLKGVILTHGSIIENWSAALIAGGNILMDDLQGVSHNMDVLINLYGPMEASTNVVALRGVTTTTDCTKIGYNFGLNSVYNLDECMRPVLLGCIGELFIGGPQVAQG
ncbi:acetyl-CoA synthetase-like protein, partial [Ramaria rubella]